MLFPNRFLGGASFLPFYSPEGVAGGGAAAGGGGDGGGQREAGTAGAAAGAAAALPGAGAGAGAVGDGGAAGSGSAAGGAGGAAGAGAGAAAGAGAGGTLAGGGGDPAKEAAAALKPGELPAGFDFRAYLAGGDKDAEKDLAKYTDPKAIYKSLRDLQAKISKGELKSAPAPLPANATPEQKAEWRTANGLPDKPEAYVEKLELPNGVVIGEADKPLVGEFAKAVFEAGGTQAEMNRAVSFYYQMQGAAEAQRAEADGGHKQAATEALIGEWGPADYKVNMNAMGTLLATMPEELKNEMLSARTPDGRMIGNTAGFIKWAAAQARELNPAATLIPPGSGDAGKTIDSEIASINEVYRKAVGGDREAHRQYYGSDGKPGLEVRQRELIHAQQQMASRGKAA